MFISFHAGKAEAGKLRNVFVDCTQNRGRA